MSGSKTGTGPDNTEKSKNTKPNKELEPKKEKNNES